MNRRDCRWFQCVMSVSCCWNDWMCTAHSLRLYTVYGRTSAGNRRVNVYLATQTSCKRLVVVNVLCVPYDCVVGMEFYSLHSNVQTIQNHKTKQCIDLPAKWNTHLKNTGCENRSDFWLNWIEVDLLIIFNKFDEKYKQNHAEWLTDCTDCVHCSHFQCKCCKLWRVPCNPIVLYSYAVPVCFVLT